MKKIIPSFFLLLLAYTAYSIDGPSPVSVGEIVTYTYYGSAVYPSYMWAAPGGSVLSSTRSGTTYTAIVQWNTEGTSNMAFLDDTYTVRDSKSVTVSGNCIPATPIATLTVTDGCGSKSLSYAQAVPGGVTWYWQTSSSGTSTVSSANPYVVTTSGTYYLRAKSNTKNCWSSGTVSVAITVSAGSPPANPSATLTPASSTCTPRAITYNETPPGGIAWYWQTSASGTSTANSTNLFTATSSGTYYVRAFNPTSTCWSSGAASIAITVNALPATPAAVIDVTTGTCGPKTVSTLTAPPPGVVWHWQTDPAGTTLSPTYITYTLFSTGTIYVRAQDGNQCWSASSQSYGPINVNDPATPANPTTTSNACGGQTLSKNGSPPANVSWYWQGTNSTGTDYTSGTATAATYSATVGGTYYLRARNTLGCWSQSSAFVVVTVNALPAAPSAPTVSANACYDKTLTKGTPPAGIGWFWQGTNSSGTDYTSGIATAATYTVGATGTYYLRSRNSTTGCWGSSTSRVVTIDKPAAPANNAFTYCEWDPMPLTTTGILSNLKWYNTGGTLLYTGAIYTPTLLGIGSYSYNVKNVSSAGCESLTAGIVTLTIPSNCDQNINAIENTAFTVNSGGTTVATGANKTYFDGFGKAIQSQSKGYSTSQVLAGQIINDINGQPALFTLPAPINSSSFVYRHKFVTIASGAKYSANDFDKRPESTNPGGVNFPTAVTSGGIGTLGWYYSSANTLEPNTPRTSYPYSRSYTPDGPDPITSKSAEPGDQHKMGSGHEVVSDRAKITNELTHYYAIRAHFVLAPNNTAIPANPGYKFTKTDSNGKKIVFFVDSDDRTLATAMLTGTSTYDNWSYTFYNDLNQVVGTVAPNGVNTINTNYPNYVTTYKYNHLGRMIETTSTDEGKTQFAYSADGKIRFSQNAEQAANSRFSYTNYDFLGRPIESGEYTQSGTGFYFFEAQLGTTPTGNSALTLVDNIGYTGITRKSDPNNRCSDYTYVEYDKQATDLPTGDALHAAQTNMFGRVSKTENAIAKTWYGYDEFGQLIWTKQYINDFSSYKTIDYSYDFAGNVTEVAYQKGVVAEDFHHYYLYDVDQRLIEVQTSVDAGATKVSRAKYFYYLHGPLKRVQLMNGVTKVQGIDYLYTINGSLKAINHADNARDPGSDTDDVFGETISYYDNDYTAASTTYTAGTQTFSSYSNQFGGAIKGVAWHSPADNQMNKNAYAFTYDPLYRLTNGDFGTMSGGPAYSFVVQSNVHKEAIGSYDRNGNINTLQRRGKNATLIGDYSYVYIANTNKLDKINHAGTLLVDYDYNNIGQAKQQVEGPKTMNVGYNALGLVKEVKNGATLMEEYFYDDKGTRLINKIYKTDGTLAKTVYYVGDPAGNALSIYEKVNTSTTLIEVPIYGATRVGTFKPSVNTYFYEVDDHLGNVRAVIGLPDTDTYRATMESENSTLEEPPTGFFNGITPRRAPFVSANVTTNYTNSLGIAVTGNEVVRINNTAPAGPGITLKVSPGDKINAEVWAYYETGSSYNSMLGVPSMVTAIASVFGGISGAPGEAGQIYNAINSGVTSCIGSGTETTLPAAYLEYIVYDANRIPTGQKGFFRVTTAGNLAKEKVLMPQITIEQPGYIYIFVYNRSNSANWVFFDEMLVTHIHSPIVAGADYYPFGLAMDGRKITDEAYRNGYQGQYSEEDEATGWNWFQLRMYDARFGRWLSPDPYGQFPSPYLAMGNAPHMFIDRDGGQCCGDYPAEWGTVLPEITITASRIYDPIILRDGFKTWTALGLQIEPSADPYLPNEVQLRRWDSPVPENSIPQPDTSPLMSFLAEEPGALESIIPIWGSGREASAAFSKGHYWTGAAYTLLAISDVFLVKSIATGITRGAWKLGSHTWKTTRSWYGRRYELAAGTNVHHWAISQKFIEKYGWHSWANQPWNLKVILSQGRYSSRTVHQAVHGKSRQLFFHPAERLWYGVPTWAKAGTVSGTGRVPGVFD